MLTEEATTMPGFRVTKPMIKVLIMCLFAFVTYGLGGVGVILLMVFFSYLRIGKDDPNKHGISTIRSSRLGGVAVLFVTAMYIFGLWAFWAFGWAGFGLGFLGFFWAFFSSKAEYYSSF